MVNHDGGQMQLLGSMSCSCDVLTLHLRPNHWHSRPSHRQRHTMSGWQQSFFSALMAGSVASARSRSSFTPASAAAGRWAHDVST